MERGIGMEHTGSINLGLIGTGRVTLERHIPSIRSLKDSRVRIAALADAKPGVAAQKAGELGIPYDFVDYRQLLEIGRAHV